MVPLLTSPRSIRWICRPLKPSLQCRFLILSAVALSSISRIIAKVDRFR